jgi:thioesterase domain-containing protein
MAADYLGQIRAVHPAGPYYLLGWSFGGLVAHELAVRLEQAGERVALLAMLDSYPASPGAGGIRDRDEARALLLDSLGYADDDAAGQPGRERRATEVLSRPDSVLAQFGAGFLDEMTDVVLHNSALLGAHVPRRYRGDAVLFVAEESWDHRRSPADAWQPHIAGRLTTHRISVHHDRLTSPAALAVIGPILAALLGRSQPMIHSPAKGTHDG